MEEHAISHKYIRIEDQIERKLKAYSDFDEHTYKTL